MNFARVIHSRSAAAWIAAALFSFSGCEPPGDRSDNDVVEQSTPLTDKDADHRGHGDRHARPRLVGAPVDIGPNSSDLDPADPDGASGGRVNGLASVRGDNQTYYAASEWGGLYKSTDGGRTWAFLPGHRPTVTWDVEVDPSDPRHVYATSFFDGRRRTLAGINVSSDGGRTWRHPRRSEPPRHLACAVEAAREEPSAFGIAIRPDEPREVFIGTNCGLAISPNRGQSWRYADPTPDTPASTVWDVVVQPGGPRGKGIVDICGDDGHFRSTDGGRTWAGGTGGLPAGRCSIVASPDESYVLLVAASDNNLWESDDGGATWTNLGRPDRGQGRIPFVAANQRSDDAAGNRFDLWYGDVSLHRGLCRTPAMPAPGGAPRCPTGASGDWVRGFTRCGDPDGQGCAHDDVGELVFDTEANADACPTIFSTDGGVYRNTDLADDCHDPNWEQPDVTPHALWLFGMAGADRPGLDGEDLYFGLQDNGAFGTTNAGAAGVDWHNEVCCDAFDVAADPTRVIFSAGAFAFGRQFRLYTAASGMLGSSEVGTYPADGLLTSFNTDESFASFGNGRYVALTVDCSPGFGGCPGANGGDGGVYITEDIGASPIVWTELGNATEPPSNTLSHVQVAFDGTTPVFYVLASGGVRLTGGSLWRFRGTDPAGTWQRIDTNDGVTGGFNIFAVDRNDADRIYAANMSPEGPRMVVSTDGGATWQADRELDRLMSGDGAFLLQTRIGPTNFTAFAGYPQPSLLAFDPENSNIVVAGGRDSGVFVSMNGGRDWDLVTDPFTSHRSGVAHIPRPMFAHFDHDNPATIVDVYIGSQGRGVFRVGVERAHPKHHRLLTLVEEVEPDDEPETIAGR